MICTLCKTSKIEYGTLCPACTLDTEDRLVRLPRMWVSLEAWLIPGVRGTAQYGGRVRQPEAPLPLDQEVLDLRSAGGIVGVLEDWHSAIRDARDMSAPPRAGSLARRVRDAAFGVADQIHFIALWEEGPQLAREVRGLVDRVRGVVRPDEAEESWRPKWLGYCVAVDASGVICGARIPAAVDRTVQCTSCLCPYPPSTWLTLRRFQPGNGQPYDEERGQLREGAAA
ncbi:hypothetical protein PV728_29405 [Streptomyces europaeiscabiei]|uniref:hypothetical protein n=1 Tax=Streptomyces europaeiscabiei TaxID=146819 RepID=UPI0029A3B4EF|nr:hypothetical protein [Streptomyces europaeiscabiei]MDX3634308.1 hypothetical protein [Streptomyces europaeiscabiei]MDX3651844.1 hypothetical protein [Streptomyces europaeiscabiei]